VTRVDFYILQDVHLSALQRFACRLATKAVNSGQPVVMHATDESMAREVDELLWHYPDRRFLPHDVQGDTGSTGAPLIVTWDEPTSYDGVLFNLSEEVPEFFTRFQRVVEIVVQQTRDQGRDRYRFYRHRGYPLYDHQMDDWETEQSAP